MKKITILSGLLLLLTAGCISYPAGMAPSSIPITAQDSYTIIRHNVTGTDTSAMLLGIIPLAPAPSTQQALIDARRQCSADALINISVETEYNFLLLFICFQKIKVTGDAISFIEGGRDID